MNLLTMVPMSALPPVRWRKTAPIIRAPTNKKIKDPITRTLLQLLGPT
jgi:hypothetical protein